jgi:hypothetical protein
MIWIHSSVLPEVEVGIEAEPQTGFRPYFPGRLKIIYKELWDNFQPILKSVVQSEFQQNNLNWMTTDELYRYFSGPNSD